MIDQPPRLILASSSPRRREILEHLGFEFDVMASDLDESTITAESPRALAMKLAYAKAQDVMSQVEGNALIIAADTVVALGDRDYGKPTDATDAARMLGELRGETHQVITAIAVASTEGGVEVDASSTDVTMRDFSDDEMKDYIASGEPMDKAGAYAIQGVGQSLIANHQGCFCNVVGFPLIRFLKMLPDSMNVADHPVPCVCEDWPHRNQRPLPWEK